METSKDISILVIDFLKLDKIFLFLFLSSGIYIAVRLLAVWSEKLQDRFNGRRLIILQLTTVISFLAYLFGYAGIFYYVFKPSKELLVGVGGSAAVAIGFALKDLVGSMVAGFILLFDRPFQVGDRVSFGGEYGEIKSIGLRSVRLTTLDDNLVTIPNSKFLTDVVASGNSGALDMMVVVPFYVSVYEDLSVIKKLLYEVVITSRFSYLEKGVSISFEEKAIADNIVVEVKVKVYVLDVKYEKNLLSDITIRGGKILNQNNIKRPVTQ